MYKAKKIFETIIIVFLCLLPLVGIKQLHNHTVNGLIIGILCVSLLVTFFLYQDSRKYIKYWLIYGFLLVLYLAISYFRSRSFNSLIDNSYSIIQEFIAVTKIVCPFILMFILKIINIKKETYKRIIKLSIMLITCSIIISNLFKIGYSSYGDSKILFNIFEWNKNIYYAESATKGIFMYANQVAVILIMLLVVAIYYVTEDEKNAIYVFLISISMLMLGTRISSMLGLVVLIVCPIVLVLFDLIKKDKPSKKLFILAPIVIIWAFLLPISPCMSRNTELRTDIPRNDEIISEEIELKSEDAKESRVNKKIKYFYDNYNPNYISSSFFETIYPIEKDPIFWFQFIKDHKNIDYRLIEQSIIKRMWKIDNRKTNYLFGISDSRIHNVINLERDFLLQYYSFGVVGSIIILLGYILYFLALVKNFLCINSFNSIIIGMIYVLFIVTAIASGNIIKSPFPTLIFSTLMSCNYVKATKSPLK